MSNKKILGQFYTTNYKYILQNMEIPHNVIDIIEPFAGNGDLLPFVEKYNVKCYDIDPKKDFIVKQDTLLYPPDMKDKFVLTNPPYLARNKSSNKVIFDKYKTNDLYKCFIEILLLSECIGGILIIPLNFISSVRKNDVELRKRFVNKFDITKMNIFEEQVFDDTAYSICCFQFRKRQNIENITDCYIYGPNIGKIEFELNSHNNYTIGGEIYNLEQNSQFKIDRATKLCKKKENFTNILAKCIDDSSESMINISIVNDENKKKYIDKTPNLTARSYAILVIEPTLSYEYQVKLVEKFNMFLNEYREKYHSLFLANYRESNSIARKRISFGLVYQICNHILQDLL